MEENKSVMGKSWDAIKNMNEDFAANIIFAMILVVSILALVYHFYLSGLLKRECSFMDSLYSTKNGYIKPLNSSDPNCKYTFKDYYCKTAYNCCSGGDYKNDYVSTCNLINVINQGCRALDFEIYSIGNDPVVATSTSDSDFVKETYNYVMFSDVMKVISDYAFPNTGTADRKANDCLIIHLRIKSTNQTMLQNLADMFKNNYDNLFLGPEYSFENDGHNLGDVPILDLNGRIIVVVDKSCGTAFMENRDFYEYVNMTSSSMFMRALRYYDVINTPDLNELQEYNKRNMTIAMPDKGISPDNPSGIVCRETGSQLVAMRYQSFDVNLEENIAFFDKNGYSFVLKPEKLRYIPITIPTPPPQNPALSYATRTITSDYYKFDI